MITTAANEIMTTEQVATRFNELAQQEKWFEIHDELFSDDVKSIDPPTRLIWVMQKAKHP
ncbi:MAG: hypothetical protein QM738_20955 [Ferruginibacter sp.]